jgi:hypothetical protein
MRGALMAPRVSQSDRLEAEGIENVEVRLL